MDTGRRRLFQVAALTLALLILAFVVSRGGAPVKPEPPAPASAADSGSASAPAAAAVPPPAADTESAQRYGIIGPATKADPHAVRRAVQSLTAPAASGPAPQAASPEKP